MTDKTHQMIGFTAAAAAFFYLHPGDAVTWQIIGTVIIGSFIGSVAPDIDQPTASIWDAIPLGGLASKITSGFLGGHRNLSHSLLGIILFYGLMYWLSGQIPDRWFLEPALFLETAMVGFVAHLLADGVTVMGIPVFWPLGGYLGFPPFPLNGLRILTGKWFENLIVLPISFVALLLVLAINQDRVCHIISVCQK